LSGCWQSANPLTASAFIQVGATPEFGVAPTYACATLARPGLSASGWTRWRHTLAVAIANDDRALLDRIAGGDQDAFASLYEQYFPGVHDFALRTLRNPDQAADVVQLTFVRAWEHIRSGDRPNSVKAWLYTIARNAAIDEIRRGKRTVLEDSGEMPSPMELQIDPDRIANPEEVVRDKELVALVWEAASALDPRDYTMLDLHLRKDLAPDELAESMGLRRDHVYVLLSRLRSSLGDAVTDLLLLRRGRKECPKLDAILTAEGSTTLTPGARKAIRLHVKSCAICLEQRRRFVSPVALFSAIAPVPVPFEVKQAIWQDIVRDIHSAPPPGETLRVEPHRPGSQTGSGFRAKAMAAAGALIGIVLLVLVGRTLPPVLQVLQ
jgi:RNA polymerase sigma factor (sigma-70 family)